MAPSLQKTSPARSAATEQFEIGIYNTTETRFIPRLKMRRVVQCVLRSHQRREGSVSVVVVDDAEMQRINRQFLNHDYSTDVISFSLDDELVDGEIYVCADMARRQAAEYGVSFSHEMMRLVAHGVLHVVGYDDADEAGRAQMRRLEDENIAAAW